ncbi:MAG: hypothetical protein OEY59_05915 [Deltaproteobacteria bacterium]|nr:hypothetical protein [Deltaproteobacteria bacterium]
MQHKNSLFIRYFVNKAVFLPLCLSIVLFSIVDAFGYDFSEVGKRLKTDLQGKTADYKQTTIAIIYNHDHRQQIKKEFNLIRIKKELSSELTGIFRVADPIIVQQIVDSNQLSFYQIRENQYILEQFADRAGSDFVLLVDLKPGSGELLADFTLIDHAKNNISQVKASIAPDNNQGFEPVPLNSHTELKVKQVVSELTPSTSALENLKNNFIPSIFNEEQNDSWIFFNPTAGINRNLHFFETLVWPKHLANTDIRPVRFRYDLRVTEFIQLGIQSNADPEYRHHSSYFYAKMLTVDDSVLPFNIALGIKKRLHWSKYNTEFSTGNESDEINLKRNSLTLQAMLTGKSYSYGILYNAYLDNQSFGLGAKFLITEHVKLFGDLIYHHYENPTILSDQALGVQLYSEFMIFTLSYQVETEQGQLGFAANW